MAAEPMRIQTALAVMSLLDIVLYGILRACADRFYSEFGVQPEEVGLGDTQLIAQSVVALATLFLLAVAGAGIAWFLVEIAPVIQQLLTRAAHRVALALDKPSSTAIRIARFSHRHRAAENLKLTIIMATFWTWWALAGGLAIRFWDGSSELAEDAKGGTRVRAEFDFALSTWGGLKRLFNNPIGLHAEHARVTWTGSRNAPMEKLGQRVNLIFLGSSAGTVILYDAAASETLRLPAGSVAICVPEESSMTECESVKRIEEGPGGHRSS